MERLWGSPCDPKTMNALALAFVGDGVFELLVREKLSCESRLPVSQLHRQAVEQVCARQQAMDGQRLWPLLTEEEQQVYRRGRNARVHHVPKHANVADYHAATALETLFGYLYLQGALARVRELFACLMDEQAAPDASPAEKRES